MEGDDGFGGRLAFRRWTASPADWLQRFRIGHFLLILAAANDLSRKGSISPILNILSHLGRGLFEIAKR